jgi:Family of unknown function (DUF6624)
VEADSDADAVVAAIRAADAGEWKRAADLWLAVAALRLGEPRGSALYHAACCMALGGSVPAALAALSDAIDTGIYDIDLLESDGDLEAVRADPTWPELHRRAMRRLEEWERTLADPGLRRELLALRRLDQAARRAVGRDWTSDVAWDEVARADARSTARMMDIVRAGGWPGRSRVGWDGAHAAWLLVQHADAEPAFQRECLSLLESAVVDGEAVAQDCAYLADRVAVWEGRPQRFGTQFLDSDTPQPIEDEANLDERRRSVGLEPMADYRRLMAQRRPKGS